MFNNILKSSISITAIAGLAFGCSPKDTSNDNAQALAAVSSHLTSVHDNYVPASIHDDGSSSAPVDSGATSSAISTDPNHDICANLSIAECQARLLRAYLLYGRAAVGLTGQIIGSVAGDLAKAPDNSSGTFTSVADNVTIQYKKQSLLEFDFLLISGSTPVGHISSHSGKYDIQLNSTVLDKAKPGSRGGMIDIQVQFTDLTHWTSQISVTGVQCNVSKPTDPTTGRITVTRNDQIWNGQSVFYNGISGEFNNSATCADQASDNNGLVIYTDFVADHVAAKAALYLMKRSETSTASIQNYGFNEMCTNYPDLCGRLATSISSTPSAVATYLNSIQNPYCLKAGAPTVAWNSDCSSSSQAVSGHAFTPASGWMTPSDFYQMQIVIPSSL